MQRLSGEDGVGEAAERVRVADEGGRARHAGEGSSSGSVCSPSHLLLPCLRPRRRTPTSGWRRSCVTPTTGAASSRPRWTPSPRRPSSCWRPGPAADTAAQLLLTAACCRRYQLQASIEQTQRPLRVTTACLMAREGRRAGDRVRDQVNTGL